MDNTEKFPYEITVKWSETDACYVALVAALTVGGHGDTLEDAVREARVAAELAIETYEELGRPVPEENSSSCKAVGCGSPPRSDTGWCQHHHDYWGGEK